MPVGRPYGSVTGGSYSHLSYSYDGDLSIDSRVNADDYFRIDSGFLSRPAEAFDMGGELDDGSQIAADNYFLIDQAFLGG
jgi:hypothetical protein